MTEDMVQLTMLIIKHALRLIPVRPEDRPLLGYRVNRKFILILSSLSAEGHPFLFFALCHWITVTDRTIMQCSVMLTIFLLVGKPDSTECQSVSVLFC